MKHLRISRRGKPPGGALDDDDEADNEFKLSPSADDDEFDAARGPGLPAAAGVGRQTAGKSTAPHPGLPCSLFAEIPPRVRTAVVLGPFAW